MWIYLTEGMVSIVEHFKDKDILVVRSREKSVLQKNFPQDVILESVRTDYRFRVFLKRKDCMKWLSKKVQEIDYSNFKDSVSDHDYHKLCTRVWYETYTTYKGNIYD